MGRLQFCLYSRAFASDASHTRSGTGSLGSAKSKHPPTTSSPLSSAASARSGSPLRLTSLARRISRSRSAGRSDAPPCYIRRASVLSAPPARPPDLPSHATGRRRGDPHNAASQHLLAEGGVDELAKVLRHDVAEAAVEGLVRALEDHRTPERWYAPMRWPWMLHACSERPAWQ